MLALAIDCIFHIAFDSSKKKVSKSCSKLSMHVIILPPTLSIPKTKEKKGKFCFSTEMIEDDKQVVIELRNISLLVLSQGDRIFYVVLLDFDIIGMLIRMLRGI